LSGWCCAWSWIWASHCCTDIAVLSTLVFEGMFLLIAGSSDSHDSNQFSITTVLGRVLYALCFLAVMGDSADGIVEDAYVVVEVIDLCVSQWVILHCDCCRGVIRGRHGCEIVRAVGE
jgi:hypothetical protein